MGFKAISINAYLKLHLDNNPNENEQNLRNRLNKAISDSKKGIKCNCGNDIWVIGAASVGNSCFSCITGEGFPDNDYEIDTILKHRKKSTNNIDNYSGGKINGFFDDDGNEVNLDLIPKPSLCISCKKNNNPAEEQLCSITRWDQNDSDDFICFAHENIITKK